MSLLRVFEEVEADSLEQVGGKGLSLGLLTSASLSVPPGFIITTEAYRNADNLRLDNKLENEIFDAFDDLGVERVAVRSSAIAEDSPDASWAGQFESYLNVEREQLIDAVKKCWASASADTVIEYAKSQSTDSERLAIAVVVQKMINSEVAGVAFSVNPINKNYDEIMIEATYGLGELLVQGMITPDNYVISKSNFEILDKTVSNKRTMIVYEDGQNIETTVSGDKASAVCLADVQIIELAKLVSEIEQYYGKPQDIEWALEQSKFYIVQSRPITTLG